jgi:hypothetical protein
MLMKRQHPRESEGVVGEVSEQDQPTTARAIPTSTELLIWGWPEVLRAVPIKRRSLERAICAGTFPAPTLHLNKRPFWRPDEVKRWAQGGGK